VIRGFISPNTCLGDTNQFKIFGVLGDYESIWDFGDGNSSILKNPSHFYESPGIYNVEVLITVEDSSFTFNKEITVYGLPDVDLGPDTAICSGDLIELKTIKPFVSYSWQDGSEYSSFLTGSAGKYWVQATDINGCSNLDTVEVSVHPVPVVDLGNDTLLCEGEKIVLDAGSGFKEVLWWNGSTEQVIETDETGNLSVEVTDVNGCKTSDEIQIDQLLLPVVTLGNDTSICEGVAIEFVVEDLDYEYLWWDGTSDLVNYASDSGEYWVSATNKCGTVTSYRTISIRDCNPDIYLPNAFTPNSDGINDSFFPIMSGYDIYESEMLIYNRFGQLIFQTADIRSGWNGTTSKGKPCDVGTYIWKISYKHYADGISLSIKSLTGSVTLLR
jgi:gliding motility-associated-like protein